MAIFVVVTDNETGRKVRLSKEMITDITCNADGTSTVHTKTEGSHVVKEDCELLKDAVKSLE